MNAYTKQKVKSLSCVRLFATPWTAAYQAPPSMGFPGKSTGVGCHRLLREDRDCTFSPVSLVRNNNIILVGKADQFWQPWWERWILHLPRLGAGGPSLERMLNRYRWVRQEALGSHTPVTTGQAGLGALPLSFWIPRALAAWSVGCDYSGTQSSFPGWGDQKTGCKILMGKGEGAWLGSLCSAANRLESRQRGFSKTETNSQI